MVFNGTLFLDKPTCSDCIIWPILVEVVAITGFFYQVVISQYHEHVETFVYNQPP